MSYRIGQGYDVHRLVEGRALILGGVEIPHGTGLLGHSDADVLTHAIIDALLGAAAIGDIGVLFPDSEKKYSGADSLDLLKKAAELLSGHGYTIENIDSTIIAQAPKLAPYIQQMRKNLVTATDVELDRISIKATTEEGLGFTGSAQGIAAQAIAMIRKG